MKHESRLLDLLKDDGEVIQVGLVRLVQRSMLRLTSPAKSRQKIIQAHTIYMYAYNTTFSAAKPSWNSSKFLQRTKRISYATRHEEGRLWIMVGHMSLLGRGRHHFGLGGVKHSRRTHREPEGGVEFYNSTSSNFCYGTSNVTLCLRSKNAQCQSGSLLTTLASGGLKIIISSLLHLG